MGTAKQRQETGKTAYELRQKYGYKWSVIARQLPGKLHNVRKAAEEHAVRHGLTWPLAMYSAGRMIYEMKAAGVNWPDIGYETGNDSSLARKYARDYARRWGRPWPVK